MADINEFYEELFQDVIATADSQGIYRPDAFFEIVTDYLVDAGEFDEAVRSYYSHSSTRGNIRVDGYCGDPSEGVRGSAAPELGLIVLDYHQEPEIATLTNSEMEAAFKRLERFLSKANEASFRNSLEPSDPGFGLADLISTRWVTIGKVRLYLLTNKKLSSRVDGKEAGEIDGKEIVYNVWDITRLASLVESGMEREELHIDFNDLPNGPVRALQASRPGSRNQIFLAAVPGLDLAHIYDRWGARLLEQNVRVFLQARSNVNKGIKRTLENEPELFFSFNNGITATAESVTLGESDEGLVIEQVENLQIVNGGQTTASIYAAYKSTRDPKPDLSKVYVQMKLSVVSPEDAKELVPRISEYANSQNKVAAADFSANHPYHVRIEEYSRRLLAPAAEGSFDRTKWFYERARGSYQDAQAHLTRAQKNKFKAEFPKSQSFTKTDLAKYLVAWTDKPYMVNRGAQKNFSAFVTDVERLWNDHPEQISEYYFKCLIAKKIVFDVTGKIVTSRDWWETGLYRAQHVALAIGALANAARSYGKAVSFLSIWNKQAISPALERALGQAADAAHEVLMKPDEKHKNISEWAKQPACWTEVKKINVAWDKAWLDELVGLDEEKEAKREGAKEQRENDGIENQMTVVEAGAELWASVYNWCVAEGEGTELELGCLRTAMSMPKKVPSEKQSAVLVSLMKRLRKMGCPYRLKRRRLV